MTDSVRLEPVPIPARLGIDDVGYGSAVIGLPSRRSALLTVVAGSAVRCLRIDESGRIDIVPGVRGFLRSAAPESVDRLWILTTHALQLVDLESNTVVESVTAGIPTYPRYLHRLDAAHLLLAVVNGQVATIVSTATRTVVRRLRMPAVDLVLPGPPMTLCSFERGIARRVGSDWSKVGTDRKIPVGIVPVRTGSHVAVTLATRERVASGSEVTRPLSRRAAALLDDDLRVRLERGVEGLERIDAVTSDGHLLGVTRTEIVRLDGETLEERMRVRVAGFGPAVGVIGPGHAIVLADRPSEPPAIFSLRF